MSTDTGFDCVLESPLGRLGIRLHAGCLFRVDFLPDTVALQAPASSIARRVAAEFEGYFEDAQQCFSVPVAPAATSFQQRVLTALRMIPTGQTRSYGEIAARLGSGARAVGNACRRNPLTIVVPCHRVVGASGIGGYAGHTAGPELQRKLWLLAHEGVDLAPLKTP
ncbi:MAG: methylated-DNA--[protein]-cysteine S-methyltransferase [Gammaproteobacteria bacterium]|nr:methylated-DNA--[protein]-cysteine S-methyltransferase [Gammaproteobacteria bacterium]